MAESTCSRCHGEGRIKAFSHIAGGVCFRCWGTGEDPQTMYQLRVWLERARREWRKLRAQCRKAPPGGLKAGLENTLKQLEAQGKANAALLAKLEQDYEAHRQLVRANQQVLNLGVRNKT